MKIKKITREKSTRRSMPEGLYENAVWRGNEIFVYDSKDGSTYRLHVTRRYPTLGGMAVHVLIENGKAVITGVNGLGEHESHCADIREAKHTESKKLSN